MESKYFKDAELRCKHCGVNKMDRSFLTWLDQLREEYGKPMRLVSAYRCPVHNQKVSTTGPNGPHTTGKAVDVAASGADAHRLVKLALHFGAMGIGVQQKGAHPSRFIHIDMLFPPSHPRENIWSY